MNTDTVPSVLRTTPLRRQRAKKSRTAFRRRILCTGIAAALVCAAAPAFAASATWLLNPMNNEWDILVFDATNWTAGGPPNGPADTATFFQTTNPALRLPALFLGEHVEVSGINYLAGADAFTISLPMGAKLTISGAGIVNNSEITQNFVCTTEAFNGALITFTNSATAGDQTVFTLNCDIGSVSANGVYFDRNSTAGHGTFINNGETKSTPYSGFYGATTQFHDSATAANGTFTSNGGTVSGALGGNTYFYDSTTAANGTFTSNGGTVSGALGGNTYFYDSTTAANGTFTSNGGTASGASGGVTAFFDNSTAGNATLTANGATVGGASGGSIQFWNASTAGNATLIANGGSNGGLAGSPEVHGGAGGSIQFHNFSTGGHANVQVNGASVNEGAINDNAGNFGGTLKFFDSANAGNGTFTTNGGSNANTQGGSTDFYGSSSAGSGTFTTNAGTNTHQFTGEIPYGIARGGTTSFHDTTTAGSGNFTTNGTDFVSIGQFTEPSQMVFWDSASAGNATFTTNGASGSSILGFGARMSFLNNTTAANATFTTNGGDGPSAAGSVAFSHNATAANATFTMNGGAGSGPSGGTLWFAGNSTAANATITMNGGTSSGGWGGLVYFVDNATAGSATITANGATVSGAKGGATGIYGSGAGNATLIANGGSNGGLGGTIDFGGNSTGGTAKVQVYGNASLTIGDHVAPGVGIGSLEGDGDVFLGANNLSVGSNNLSTAFFGVIQDGGYAANGSTGGALTKTGTGTLTLTGANTYTGGTTVAAGTLSLGDGMTPNASLGTGDVTVNADATFHLGLVLVETFANKIVNNGHVVADSAGAPVLAGSIGGGITMSGLITGTGDFTKTGESKVTLSHVNDYTGNTYVQQDMLRAGVANPGGIGATGPGAFGNNSAVTVSGSGILQLGGNHVGIGSLAGDAGGIVQNVSDIAATLTTGGNNTSTTFAGIIQNGISINYFLIGDGGPNSPTGGQTTILSAPLSLWKIGSGTQTLTGANTYTGGTTIAAGTLAAGNAKAFGDGNLTMTGGTLRTTGPLAVNLGKGNILFAGGTYAAKIGGTTPGVTHDQLVTTGSANISGGMIALLQQNGFLLKAGNQIVLLSAAGGVAGGTANGTAVPASSVSGLSAFSNSPLLIPVVNLYTTSVVLEAMQGSFAGISGFLGFTPNQKAVAAALDSLIAQTGGKTGIFQEIDFLDNQSLAQLRAALDRISPEELTSIFDLTKSLANIQSTNIQRRLEEIRNTNAADIAALGGLSGGGGAPGPVGRPSKEVPMANEERWGLWFTGSGEFTHVGSTTNAAGFSLDSGGVTAGVDYRFTDHFAAGISLGYMNTTASLANGGKIDADGGRVGAYATYYDRGFYLDAAVSGGFNSYSTRRSTPNNTTASGKPDGAEINVLFATGYDWKWKGLTLGPTASFQYTNVQLDGFTETGGFAPLSVIKQNADSARSALGFHATFDTKVGRTILRPEVRAAWQHEFGDTSYSLTSSFATLGGSAFTVAGPETGRDSLLIGAGLSVLWNERFSIYAYYDGELLRTNYSSHNISAGFRYRF